eukprot:g33082.t1
MTAKFCSNFFYKFADDTTVVGKILNDDKYRKKTGSLVAWCTDNNLSLNVSKMKGLVIDVRKQSGSQSGKFLKKGLGPKRQPSCSSDAA